MCGATTTATVCVFSAALLEYNINWNFLLWNSEQYTVYVVFCSAIPGTGNGYIEGGELDGFLREFVASANATDVSPEVCVLVHVCVFVVRMRRMPGALCTHKWNAVQRVRYLCIAIVFLLNSRFLCARVCHLSAGRDRWNAGRAEGVLHGSLRRQSGWQNRYQRGNTNFRSMLCHCSWWWSALPMWYYYERLE